MYVSSTCGQSVRTAASNNEARKGEVLTRNAFISQRLSKMKNRENVLHCVGGGCKELGETEGVPPEADG